MAKHFKHSNQSLKLYNLKFKNINQLPHLVASVILTLIMTGMLVFFCIKIMDIEQISTLLTSDSLYKSFKIDQQMNYVSLMIAITFGIAAVMISIASAGIYKINDLFCEYMFHRYSSCAYNALLDNIPIIRILEYDGYSIQIGIDSKFGVLNGLVFSKAELDSAKNQSYEFNYLYPKDKLLIPKNYIRIKENQIQFNVLCDLNNDYIYIADISFLLQRDQNKKYVIVKSSLHIYHYYTTRKNLKKWKEAFKN